MGRKGLHCNQDMASEGVVLNLSIPKRRASLSLQPTEVF